MKSFALFVLSLVCVCGSVNASDSGCVGGKCLKAASVAVSSSVGLVRETVSTVSGAVVENTVDVTRAVVSVPVNVATRSVKRTRAVLYGGGRRLYRFVGCR